MNLREVLSPAYEAKYGIAAYDVVNAEYAAAIVEVAEERKSPLILMVYEGYLRYNDMDLLTSALLKMAERASVPIAVHMDHATSWDVVVRAVKAGCTSVMLDSSLDSYETNVARTREVVQLCRALNVSVEAELGAVGGSESIGQAFLDGGSEADATCFTDPEEAGRFVRDTGVDALAVSVGNIHGLYKGKPELDLDRIQDVSDRAGIPLVLHGGSGLSDKDFQNAIERGVCKINVNTSLIVAAGTSIKDAFVANPNSLNFPELLMSSYKAVAIEAGRLMDVFGSTGKAG